MGVKQSINLIVGVLVAALAILTVNAVFSSSLLSRSMHQISLYHNEQARRNDEITHALMDVGHELELFASKERVPPSQLLRYLDELLRQISLLQQQWEQEIAVLGVISRTVESARARWQAFFDDVPWTELTADAMQTLSADVNRELSIVRAGFSSIARNPENRAYRAELQNILRLVRICEVTAEKFNAYSELHLTRAARTLPEIERFLEDRLALEDGADPESAAAMASQSTFALRSALYAVADEGRSGVTTSSDSLMDVVIERYADMREGLRRLQQQIDTDIAETQTAMLTRIMQARTLAVVAMIVAVVLALFVSIRTQRALNRGFGALLSGVEVFAGGRFDTRIPETDKREFRVLAQGFNSMAESLQDREVERHLHLEAIEVARQRADDASAAKSRFLASMSHEIRTPMNGVLGMAELLATDESLSSRQRNFVETIQESGQTLLALINDILDLSKIEAGHLELDPAPFRLCARVESVGQLMAPVAQQKGLELTVIVDHALSDHRIGDAARIRQILLNLVGNAIKFTAEGSVTLRVGPSTVQAAGAANDTDQVRFEVVDTGVGIAPDDQQRIFQPFSQVTESARGTGGTGLGLSICRNLVALMQGEMGVHSRAGQGSTFWFEVALPVTEAPAEPAQAVAVPPDAPVGYQVLVCSRSRATRHGLQHHLQRLHVPHVLAGSARDGLVQLKKMMQTGVPHIMLLVDGQLEDTGGLEFVHSVRDAYPDLHGTVIALCNAGDESALRSAWASVGIHTWLHKPVNQSALYDELCQAADVGAHPETQRYAPSKSLASVPPASTSASASASASATGSTPASAAASAVRVCVAEDNLVNQQVVSHMLEALACEVLIAENGRRCLEVIDSEQVDIVLMDCDMPVMDGFEATAEIRRRSSGDSTQRLPVVALTANALQGDRERCLAAGMDDFLSKPFSMDQLDGILAQYVAGYGSSAHAGNEDAPANRKAA